MHLKPGISYADASKVINDRGGIVLGWLTKLVVVLGVCGVIAFDLISLGTGRMQAEDHAQAAVRAASEAYRSAPDVQAAYNAAAAAAATHGDTIEAPSFSVGPDRRITLTLHRVVPTMIIDRVPAIRSWATITTTVSARPAT